MRKKKKKNSAFFILSFSIGHVYGRASLLHWVYALERVRMGTSFWDSILVYVLGDSMSRLFDFCDKCERPLFRIFGSFLYSSSHLFRMRLISMLWCKLTITHFSISLFSYIFVLFLHSILALLISFFYHPAWCLTWDWYTHIILVHLMWPFIYHHFSCGDP